jgi:hypothetical protein
MLKKLLDLSKTTESESDNACTFFSNVSSFGVTASKRIS